MPIIPLSAATTACETLNWRISNLELQKLLYLAHMTFMGRTGGRPLVNEAFEAWDFGPVLPSLYSAARIFGSDPITQLPRVNRNPALQEHRTIAEVVQFFGDKSPGELVDLTHVPNGAWDRNYVPRRKHVRIPNEDVLREYRMRNHAIR